MISNVYIAIFSRDDLGALAQTVVYHLMDDDINIITDTKTLGEQRISDFMGLLYHPFLDM